MAAKIVPDDNEFNKAAVNLTCSVFAADIIPLRQY
jgi:hypothetical protein